MDQPVKRPATRPGKTFDPAVFLEAVAPGRVISTHPKGHVLFSQGDIADSVIHIRKGR